MKLAVSALLTVLAFMGLATAESKASTPGEELNPKFNYVGLFVGTTVAGDVRELVYKPGDGPEVGIKGKYTDANGNFTIDKEDGLEFPPVAVDLDLLVIDGKIGLTEDGTGNYNSDTGELSLDIKLALELGVSDLGALSEEVGIPLGTGELACEFSPLEVAAGTAKDWPGTGKAFADKADFKEGAIAGAWRSRPAAKAVKGEQSVCNIIGGFLKPVGGIWLGNTAEVLTRIPGGEEPPPPPPTCQEFGKIGIYPNCFEPNCPEGQVGIPPDCKPVVAAPKITSVKVAKAKIKAGKKAKIKVTVKNTGDAAFSGKISLKSSNKQVKVKKTVNVKVAAGKSKAVTVVVSTTKKAIGKAIITAKVGDKTGKGVVTVQKAKKKR